MSVSTSNQTATGVGIMMENGSGGFMSDLTFFGGNAGIVAGSQQFTMRKAIWNPASNKTLKYLADQFIRQHAIYILLASCFNDLEVSPPSLLSGLDTTLY
jgi:Pectate lyase superfamily protein